MFEYVTGLVIVWFVTYMYSQFGETTSKKIAEILLTIIFVSAPIAIIYDAFTECDNDPLNIRWCNTTTPYEDGYLPYAPGKTQ
tara:strand:+ start:2441 stop:2689 length:249 start_codon:yes stop_codon:yes gene_type:complete